MDDPRNTDNAWIETVAISVHFEEHNDVEMKRMNSVHAIMHPYYPYATKFSSRGSGMKAPGFAETMA